MTEVAQDARDPPLCCVLCKKSSHGLWCSAPSWHFCAEHSASCSCSLEAQEDKGICVECLERLERATCITCRCELWRCPFCRGVVSNWQPTPEARVLHSQPVIVSLPSESAPSRSLADKRLVLGDIWELEELRRIRQAGSRFARQSSPPLFFAALTSRSARPPTVPHAVPHSGIGAQSQSFGGGHARGDRAVEPA